MNPCLIIAELGINHNGNPALAAEMIAAAAEAGADIVKFHSYKAERVMTSKTPLADYMKEGESGGFLDMARRFELTEDRIRELKETAEEHGVEFLSSPFDVDSVQQLAKLKVRRLKIPSGELVNPLLIREVAFTKLPLIVSTGMADLEEVGWAVGELEDYGSGPVTLLHCTSQYPAEHRFVNLAAMQTLRDAFSLPVGFSDHTPGIEISIAAATLGACTIEKHFTLDRSLPGPDQAASLEPSEFREMVDGIRHVEEAMGTGEKKPTPPELENLKIVRKSLVMACPQKAGTVLTHGMVTAKRPGTGIPALEYDHVIGRRLKVDVEEDHMLEESNLD